MTKKHVIACDQCGKEVTIREALQVPWLVLAQTALEMGGRGIDHERDICSPQCGIKMLERVKWEGVSQC
jgi:hypothetical protein